MGVLFLNLVRNKYTKEKSDGDSDGAWWSNDYSNWFCSILGAVGLYL